MSRYRNKLVYNAVVNGIMEGKEWIYNNGAVQEQTVEQIKKRIDNAALNQMEQVKLSAFNQFMQSL